jgi:crotonobetainyl-CoA:carnitine CoA-transferase CaiB-like acyl-CoA transferase
MRVHVRTAEGEPVELLGSPFHVNGHAITDPGCPPSLGQDSAAVLRDVLGLTVEEIADLHRDNVIE